MIKFFRNISQRIKRNIFAKNQKIKINQKGSLIYAFNESKTIFVHIPKTAGISIIKAIYGDVSKEGHRSIYFYKKLFDKDFEDFFTFSFIRNPYERLYSSYKFLQNGGMNQHDKSAFQKYLSHYSDFEDFVLNGLNSEIIFEIIHFIPQSEFICNNDGKIIVDFIGGVKQDITKEGKLNNVEEMVQNISIMITAGKGFLKNLEEFNYILEEIEQFSNMNHKKYPSLSSKIVFKFMDLSEELED